jgi:hypothetical protein
MARGPRGDAREGVRTGRRGSRPRPCYARPVNADFNWWLLIVGLVVGAGLVWLILADGARREADVTLDERPSEARWIGDQLRRSGRTVDDDTVNDILDLHAAYLTALPPDESVADESITVTPAAGGRDHGATTPGSGGGSALADEDGLARSLR